MTHRGRLVEVLHKAETGPIVEEADFKRRILAPKIKSIIKHYGITYDKAIRVNSDDDLADRVFQAGMQLACEVVMYCQSTNRQMLWSRAELEEGLRFCPAEAHMGLGLDAVTVRARRPEDNGRVIVSGGAYGVPFPEQLYVPVSLSYLKEPIIDVTDNASLETVYGHPVKAGPPWEVLAVRREAELALLAANIAG